MCSTHFSLFSFFRSCLLAHFKYKMETNGDKPCPVADHSEQGTSEPSVCLCRPDNKGQHYSCPCAHHEGMQGEKRYSSTTGVRSASHPGHFTLQHDRMGGWRGSTAGLNVLEKTKCLPPPGTETQSIHPTVCSLYQLCCPKSGTVLYISIKHILISLT